MKQDNQEGISKAVLEGKEDSVDRRIVPFVLAFLLLYLLYHRIVFFVLACLASVILTIYMAFVPIQLC